MRLSFTLGALAATLAFTTAMSTPALACGGFFCSQTAPVNQRAERILFTVAGTSVEAHIQIAYEGPAESFSWVLPMPEVPEFGIGTDELFRVLHQQTDPRFAIKWENEQGCESFRSNCGCMMMPEMAADGGGGDPAPDASVEILAAGQVGPYDYKVVQSEDGQELFDWLTENGYDVPTNSKGLISHYSDIDFVFLALKLVKDADSGDIQPIVLSYESDMLACIPLQLTAIAAQTDMPIYTWVLAEARAVPLNFFHVVLNEQAIDWLNCAAPAYDDYIEPMCGGNLQGVDCAQEYLDTVTEAANSAAGHGFVTEYAGSTEMMKETLYWEGRFDTESLKGISEAAEFLSAMLGQGFPRNTMVQELIRTYIPMPPEDTLPENCQGEQMFYSTWNIENCLPYMDPSWTFDAEGFATDLDDRIAKPLQQAQGLFDNHSYMSRLFTTVSPADMDRDPLFSFNPDLPDVSNVHTATATATCKPETSWNAEKIVLTYPSGATETFEGDFQSCDGVPVLADPPNEVDAVGEIQVMEEQGEPEAVPLEAVEEMDDVLDSRYPSHGQSTVVSGPGRNDDPIANTGTIGTDRSNPAADVPVTSAPAVPAAETGGCQGGGSGSQSLLWLSVLSLLGLCRRFSATLTPNHLQ
jgi:hypothetical protein